MSPASPVHEGSWAGDSSLSPELRAVVACARAVVDPTRFTEFLDGLAACADPERLCRTAITHGMLGQLHRLITSASTTTPGHTGGVAGSPVDPVLVARVATLQRLAVERGLRQTGYLLRTLGGLQQAGVQVIPYKGPAWAETLYGDVAMRTWADLDLLVPYEQVPAVRDTLLGVGFVDGNPFNPTMLKRRHRGWSELHFVSSDTRMEMDVHWGVTVGFSGRSIPAEDLVSRSKPSTLLGRQVLGLSDTDMLLASAIHGSRHRWETVELMLGLALLVASTPVSWEEILRVAQSTGCRRRLTVSVAHVCRVLGVPWPRAVADRLAHDRIGRLVLGTLGPHSLARESPEGSGRELTVMAWTFLTEDSLLGALWHAGTRLLLPGPADWAVVAFPRGLSWLYWLLRPVRLAGKWGKRLIRR